MNRLTMYKILVPFLLFAFLVSCQNIKPTTHTVPRVSLKTKPLYLMEFSAGMRRLPDDFFVMTGVFLPKKLGVNNWALYLRPVPLDTYSMLFGPELNEGCTIQADIYASSSGRRYPAFGIGAFGISGLKLLCRTGPKKATLQLVYNESQIIASVPCNWMTDQWTRMQLTIFKKDGKVEVYAKCWTLKEKEPRIPAFKYIGRLALDEGQSSIWGIPYSGRDIFYDNLTITKP